jgi:hypothetical protein
MRLITQAQINEYRDKFKAQFKGFPIKVASNGYGVRVECLLCHESGTHDPAGFVRRHFANNH